MATERMQLIDGQPLKVFSIWTCPYDIAVAHLCT